MRFRGGFDELLVRGVDVVEDLVEFTGLDAVVGEQGERERGHGGEQEVQVGVGDKVHCYLVEVYVQNTFKPHRTRQV